jgi:hypothetical protein
MSNIRNAQLLQRVQAHPLKAQLAKALDIAESFSGDIQFLQLDKNLSPEGRDNQRRTKLRAAIRDLRDAKVPLDKLEAKLTEKRKAVAMPAFDPADTVGFLRRQELRAAMRTMERGPRALLLQDPAFADAMLELPPILSGLVPDEQFLVDAIKETRLKTLFAPQLAEIDALADTVAEARAIVDIAHNDLKSESGMQEHVFNEFVKPIEAKQGAPWLRRAVEEGREVVRVVDLDRGVGRVATEREILDGKYYKNFEEYRADRGAA